MFRATRPAAVAIVWIALFGATAGLTISCAPQQDAETTTAASTKIENEVLGLALSSIPPYFELEENSGDQLVLTPSDQAVEGRFHIEVGPLRLGRGVNLVEEVKAQKAAIEAKTEGKYHGNLELMSPVGTVFNTRGRYLDDSGDAVEEIRALAVHPTENRLLALVYIYPEADQAVSKARGEELFGLLGEIEGLLSDAEEIPAETAETAEDEPLQVGPQG